ncbi:hypothetical protein Sjap_022473 [Stephania japonica]|uniref:Beta-glucosidase n=1 Tax=Stephania japonica TaxID=461633 RepID=A0AAP0HUG1_9MAGN
MMMREMSLQSNFFFFSIIIFTSYVCTVLAVVTVGAHDEVSNVPINNRGDFPTGFVFGAGSSAYQIEGAAFEDGRKPSIWDTFTHAGKMVDKGTGDVTSDQYHHYKEDVKLMYEMGLDAYRFSISWSRLIPDGRGAVNPKGLTYYNNLINELVSYGIEPHVTLCHNDNPQSLQDEYGGYLSTKFIEDFAEYADVCFKEFGDRVKNWITFNEPNIQTFTGNDLGIFPPGRCSYPFGRNCSMGNSTTEPYLGAHNLLLAHAAAVKLYREKYQGAQRGQIGITILSYWVEPRTKSIKDIAAAQRMLDFHLGWFLDPLVYGDYPATMKKIVGSRLPLLTENDSELVKGSYDFIGLNHYLVFYVEDLPRTSTEYGSDYILDMSIMPSYAQTMNDTGRIEFLQSYIGSVLLAMRSGSDVRGYFVWSFMDCFELIDGYRSHYGLYAVDFNDASRKRYPRRSAHWFSSFLGKIKRRDEMASYLSRFKSICCLLICMLPTLDWGSEGEVDIPLLGWQKIVNFSQRRVIPIHFIYNIVKFIETNQN